MTHERLKDSRGGLIPTVVANPIGEIAQEEMVAAARSQEDQLLLQISATPSATQPDLARSLGWFMRDGAPAKMKSSARSTSSRRPSCSRETVTASL